MSRPGCVGLVTKCGMTNSGRGLSRCSRETCSSCRNWLVRGAEKELISAQDHGWQKSLLAATQQPRRWLIKEENKWPGHTRWVPVCWLMTNINILYKLCTVWGFFCVQELPRKPSFQSWIMVYRQYTCTESYSLSWISSIFSSSSAVNKVCLWHWDMVPFAALPPAGVYNWNEKCVWRQDAFQTRIFQSMDTQWILRVPSAVTINTMFVIKMSGKA